MMHDINMAAAIVAGIAYYAIGALWYTVLFGNAWMKSQGMDPKNPPAGMKESAGKSMGLQLIVCLVLGVLFAVILKQLGVMTMHASLLSAFWIWLAFRATAGVTSVLFDRKSWMTFAINQGYDLVGFLAMAAILAAWK